MKAGKVYHNSAGKGKKKGRSRRKSGVHKAGGIHSNLNQLSMKEIERHFQVAQSTAAGIVVRLERKGFVGAAGDRSDRRIKLVRLTAEGEGCCKKAESLAPQYGYPHKENGVIASRLLPI